MVVGSEKRLPAQKKNLLSKAKTLIKLGWTHAVFWLYGSLDQDYHSSLGSIYFESACYEKAIKHFNKSEKKHNKTSSTLSKFNWYYIGYSYYNLGDFRRAAQYLEKYLLLNPNDYETLLNLANAQALLNGYEDALKIFAKLTEQTGHGPDLYIRCSVIYSEMDDKEKALDHLALAEERIDNEQDRRIVRAMKLSVEKIFEPAIEILNKAIADSISTTARSEIFSNVDMHFSLSELQKRASDHAGSIGTLEQALKLHPGEIWLMNALAAALADQGEDLGRALDLISRALKTTPRNPIFLGTKGWVLFKMGRQEEALRLVCKCLESMPNSRVAAEHLQDIEARQAKSKRDMGNLA